MKSNKYKPFLTIELLFLLLVFVVGNHFSQTTVKNDSKKTKVIVLGVGHSTQLIAESYQPAVFRAFFDRIKPDAICIERSPQEFARNDFYEFTYEQQYLTVPYAKEHRIPLYPVDWLPSPEDTLLAFNLPDLDRPLFLRRASGFLGFQNFTDKNELNLDLFYAETEGSRKLQKDFANRLTPDSAFDFPRRLFLYRTFMQAKRIFRVATDNPGKTILVVVGSNHKTDIEEVLKSEETIEIVQPSNFGKPEATNVASSIRREDLLAVAVFNLLGVQSKTEVINWNWIKRIIENLGKEPMTTEVLLLKTRWQVLTKQLDSKQAIENYQKALISAKENELFTWNGVKDRSRVDSYFDPFGNLSLKQRIQLEIAREASKLNQNATVEEILKQIKSQLSPIKAQQLEGYWEEFLVKMT